MGIAMTLDRHEAEELTKVAESGDTGKLADELNAMKPEERYEAAKQVAEINKEHRRENASLPELQVIDDNGDGRMDKMVAKYERTGMWKNLISDTALKQLFGEREAKDLYKDGPWQQFSDYVGGAREQMQQSVNESVHNALFGEAGIWKKPGDE
jgi:hypothetical protein